MSSPTTNKGYTYPAHGGSVNAWDTPLNANFDQIDLNFGGIYNVNLGSSIAGAVFNSSYATVSSTTQNIVFPSSNSQNIYYNVSGTSSSFTPALKFPISVGSFYIINNASGGSITAAMNGVSATTTISTGAVSLIVTDASTTNAPIPLNQIVASAFASGTSMLFINGSAPSGWTQDTSQTDRLLRIISDGSAGNTGGQWAISGVTVQNHTLATSEIPSHNHSYNDPNSNNQGYTNGSKNANSGTFGDNTGNTGGGGGHNHGLSADGTWRPNYQNVMRATKN